MKTYALAFLAAAGLTLLTTGTAQAGKVHVYMGNPYGSYLGSHGHHGWNHWGTGHRGHYHYHDTSHYDYVPPRVIPHGNHFHYVPGGYYFHQTGHYHYHRGHHHHH
jgi:hypothetical protein